MPEALPVLVVEDDDALREALTDTLELSGYTAIERMPSRPWPGWRKAIQG